MEKKTPLGKAKALFDFTAENEGELSFKADDIIWILDKDDVGEWDGWWEGRCDRTQLEGFFPAEGWVEELQFDPAEYEKNAPAKPALPSAPKPPVKARTSSGGANSLSAVAAAATAGMSDGGSDNHENKDNKEDKKDSTIVTPDQPAVAPPPTASPAEPKNPKEQKENKKDNKKEKKAKKDNGKKDSKDNKKGSSIGGGSGIKDNNSKDAITSKEKPKKEKPAPKRKAPRKGKEVELGDPYGFKRVGGFERKAGQRPEEQIAKLYGQTPEDLMAMVKPKDGPAAGDAGADPSSPKGEKDKLKKSFKASKEEKKKADEEAKRLEEEKKKKEKEEKEKAKEDAKKNNKEDKDKKKGSGRTPKVQKKDEVTPQKEEPKEEVLPPPSRIVKPAVPSVPLPASPVPSPVPPPDTNNNHNTNNAPQSPKEPKEEEKSVVVVAAAAVPPPVPPKGAVLSYPRPLSQSSGDPLLDFLTTLKLENLHSTFKGEEMEFPDDFMGITHEELASLGIKMGPRRRIIIAMQQFQAEGKIDAPDLAAARGSSVQGFVGEVQKSPNNEKEGQKEGEKECAMDDEGSSAISKPLKSIKKEEGWVFPEDAEEEGVSDGGLITPRPSSNDSGHADHGGAAQQYYPYSVLTGKSLPNGVDKSKLEVYLSPEEFSKVFGMPKDAFMASPAWKQRKLKQDKGLF